jgi:hypothetical protein
MESEGLMHVTPLLDDDDIPRMLWWYISLGIVSFQPVASSFDISLMCKVGLHQIQSHDNQITPHY